MAGEFMPSHGLFRASITVGNPAVVGFAINRLGMVLSGETFTRLLANETDRFVIMPISEAISSGRFV